MNEEFNKEDSSAQEKEDLISLVKKIKEQLVYLEKKIDMLINQQQQRSHGPSQYYKKPRHEFKPGHHEYHGKENNFEKGRYFHKHRDLEHRKKLH